MCVGGALGRRPGQGTVRVATLSALRDIRNDQAHVRIGQEGRHNVQPGLKQGSDFTNFVEHQMAHGN